MIPEDRYLEMFLSGRLLGTFQSDQPLGTGIALIPTIPIVKRVHTSGLLIDPLLFCQSWSILLVIIEKTAITKKNTKTGKEMPAEADDSRMRPWLLADLASEVAA